MTHSSTSGQNGDTGDIRNVIIIGGACAGYTAGIYSSRANLQPLLFAGEQPGGQLSITTDVENYPGFPEGIMGPELMDHFQKQAERFGTEIIWEAVTEVDFKTYPFLVRAGSAEHRARAIVIATGASPRTLGVPGEEELIGYGVSYCATCDGFFFSDKVIAIVGGGDSAAEEALYLTHFATKVYLIHRRDELRASKIMQDRVMAHEKIEPIWNTVVTEMLGSPSPEEGLQAARLQDTQTGEEREFPLDGLFVAIGHTPNTQLFEGQIDLDDQGYILADKEMRTNIPGVFASGDCQDHVFRQAVTAAGTGCAAAIMSERFIGELQGEAYPGWDTDPRAALEVGG